METIGLIISSQSTGSSGDLSILVELAVNKNSVILSANKNITDLLLAVSDHELRVDNLESKITNLETTITEIVDTQINNIITWENL